MEELKAGNLNGSYCFMPADASRLSDVDVLCEKLQTREKSLDLLFLSAGGIAFSKQETEVGIDVNHILRYYSRMRFIHNLVPLLEAAEEPRVISVLAGGKEVSIEEDNLDLRKRFSLSTSNGYPATMSSLAFEVLASQHPPVSFIHEFPGIVATPLLKKTMGSVLGTVLSLLIWPISISEEESGEWQVFLSTSPSFPAKGSASADVATEQGIRINKHLPGKLAEGSIFSTITVRT